MYVTAVTPFLVDPGTGKNWLFVKVDTSDGISGWGECYTQADRDQSIVAHVRQLGRYLVERSPLHIKHFTYMAYNDFAGKRGAMDLYSAVSGIEQALWDITGKRCGMPVYNLLGGPCRDKIRVYANGVVQRCQNPRSLRGESQAGSGARVYSPQIRPVPWSLAHPYLTPGRRARSGDGRRCP